VATRFPTTYKESMNTVLTQVCVYVCVCVPHYLPIETYYNFI